MTGTSRKALVIGAAGGIGGAVAGMLATRGWQVTALSRDPAKAKQVRPALPVSWVAGDAMQEADVVRAAEGAAVIFHGANPPGYRNWAGTVLPMLASTIAAARAQKARIVFPGTVYNFGPDADARVAEDAPQNPMTRKGRLRVLMERRLGDSGVPALIVRAGDFFGPGAANSWLSQGIMTPGRPLDAITYPGEHSVGHAWAYLPDLAETFGRLLDRADDLAPFERFHFAGHWLERGIALVEAIRRVAGRDLPIRRLPWWAIRLIAPVHETMREMLEMRYLWQRPLQLDNAKLVAFLGAEPHSPLDEAIAVTLAALGCLPPTAGPTRAAAFA